MRVTTAYNRLLRLPGASVIDVSFTGEGVIVCVRLRRRRRVCARCGQTGRRLVIHDHRVKRWRHLDLGATRCVIECELRLLRCADCRVVRAEPVPWARPGAHHTRQRQAGAAKAWSLRESDGSTEDDAILGLLDSDAARETVYAGLSAAFRDHRATIVRVVLEWIDLAAEQGCGPTVRDVAARTGLGHSTVAHALNDFRERYLPTAPRLKSATSNPTIPICRDFIAPAGQTHALNRSPCRRDPEQKVLPWRRSPTAGRLQYRTEPSATRFSRISACASTRYVPKLWGCCEVSRPLLQLSRPSRSERRPSRCD